MAALILIAAFAAVYLLAFLWTLRGPDIKIVRSALRQGETDDVHGPNQCVAPDAPTRAPSHPPRGSGRGHFSEMARWSTRGDG